MSGIGLVCTDGEIQARNPYTIILQLCIHAISQKWVPALITKLRHGVKVVGIN